jgi:hypothetical protein
MFEKELQEYKKRRDAATKRNAYVLLEALQKSTQEWTTKLTGIQHWQPENGYDVFVFDPDNTGEVYVLLRRWNEAESKFDEKFQKHATGEKELPVAVDKTKTWVFDNWETLKTFKGDVADAEKPETPAEELGYSDEPKVTEAETLETSLDKATEEAFEDSTAEVEAKFDNFMDNGVQTDKEREEMWKHPWIRRIATQLNEMEKDHSQFERVLQNSKDRREKALQKSLHVLTGNLKNITEKVKASV